LFANVLFIYSKDITFKGSFRYALAITTNISPSAPQKETTQYQKQKARKRFKARAGIKPVISHIKRDHRILRNYVKAAITIQ
jgi:hypothetical protein